MNKLDNLPKTRSEAKKQGSIYYFTGKPCKYGHLSPKLTTSWQCVECRTLARNSSKGKQYHREYVKEWNKGRDIQLSTYRRRWRDKNPDYGYVWRQTHMGEVIASCNQRRARKLNALPSWLTKEDLLQIEELYNKAQQLTKETGVPHEVDHYYPLQGKTVSGLHCLENLQLLTKSLNSSKGNKHPDSVDI